ncbi:hypothetical protein EV652_101465 [Kribbella steppae]|uniref:Uncharacterized protein n=1 Tax=Kribbella steppae TaxID=2512223 RepID=A0A4R2HVP8_9ACTN|nr:hypothetical protein EV652_101465 [Kribbella steppae]
MNRINVRVWLLREPRERQRGNITVLPSGGDASARIRRPEPVTKKSVTTPLRTLVDCARTLSLGPAPAIADSPARARSVSRAELLAPLVGSWAVRVAAPYSGSPSIWTDAASRFLNRYCERC